MVVARAGGHGVAELRDCDPIIEAERIGNGRRNHPTINALLAKEKDESDKGKGVRPIGGWVSQLRRRIRIRTRTRRRRRGRRRRRRRKRRRKS